MRIHKIMGGKKPQAKQEITYLMLIMQLLGVKLWDSFGAVLEVGGKSAISVLFLFFKESVVKEADRSLSRHYITYWFALSSE